MKKYYDAVIVGTDSDQEGYGIYYLLEHYLHIEKKEVLRHFICPRKPIF